VSWFVCSPRPARAIGGIGSEPKLAENTEKERAQERESLQNQVAAQGLTDLEIQRLTSDRHQLDEAYRATSARLTEATQAANDLEVELQRAFGKIEKLAEDYHSKAAKLGLLPTGPEGFEDVDFAQELNGASTTPQGIVPDCTSKVRPAIVSMKQAVMRQRHSSTSEIFNVESDVAKLAEAVANVSSEIVEWEGRWQRVTKELNDSKEVRPSCANQCRSDANRMWGWWRVQAFNNDMAASNAELDRVQAQVNQLKTHMHGGVLAADQRLAALDNEYVPTPHDPLPPPSCILPSFPNTFFSFLRTGTKSSWPM
jgi:kinetochore protein NDC80